MLRLWFFQAAAFISTIKSYWSRVVENPWILAAAIGLATCVIVIVLVICCCCCCRRRRAEKSAQLRSQEDVVDAQRLARALELSMADQGCQRREPQTAELAQALSLSMAEPHMAVQPDDLALALELSLADQQGQRAREEPARAPELCMPFLNGPGNAPRPASPCPPSAPVWPGHGAGQV